MHLLKFIFLFTDFFLQVITLYFYRYHKKISSFSSILFLLILYWFSNYMYELFQSAHSLCPWPSTEHINGFGRRASDGGANFQMCYQRVDGVYSQPGSQAEVTTDTKEGTQYGQSQPIPGALRGDETEETHHRWVHTIV